MLYAFSPSAEDAKRLAWSKLFPWQRDGENGVEDKPYLVKSGAFYAWVYHRPVLEKDKETGEVVETWTPAGIRIVDRRFETERKWGIDSYWLLGTTYTVVWGKEKAWKYISSNDPATFASDKGGSLHMTNGFPDVVRGQHWKTGSFQLPESLAALARQAEVAYAEYQAEKRASRKAA